MKKTYKIDVDCANCANKMEIAANETEGVKNAVVNFMTLKMSVEFDEGANPKEVSRKLCAMVNKLKPDVVMCGPAFNYLGYGKMAANIAYDINQTTDVPAFAAMSIENVETINEFKDKVHIVKTPKKGGTGLNEALDGMCKLAKALTDKEDLNSITSKYCF